MDLTPFAQRNALQNMTKEFAQGSLEQGSLKLRNYAAPPGEIGQPLPVIREGLIPIMYIQRLSAVPSDYNVLWSAIAYKNGIKDDDWRGSTDLSFSTPTKALNTVLGAVRFTPQTEGNDVLRLRALGNRWRNPLFDFSLAGATPNITYPLPVPTADNLSYISGETVTDYTDRSVADIIRDIMGDPGQESDTGYPVPVRQWWWEARFKNDDEPTQGIVFKLFMEASIPAHTGPDLLDTPDPDLPDALTYEAGATIDVDVSTVVRKVRVSGDPTVWPVAHLPAEFKATGDTPPGNVWTPSSAWVRKYDGVDGVYDTTAVSGVFDGTQFLPTQIYQDFDMVWQIQETYLAHDPFVGPDQAPLTETALASVSDPAFPRGYWHSVYLSTVEAEHNVMRRIGNRARALYPVGAALSLLDAQAATCIVRGSPDFGGAGPGAVLVGRAVTDADNVLVSGIVLYRELDNTWNLYEYDSYAFGSLLSSSPHAVVDGQQVKVNFKYNQVQVFFGDVIDDNFTQESYTFNQHETLYGIGCLLPDVPQDTIWRDFNVTEFWGDKGIGVGDLLFGSEWFWIGYGYVFNTNGTFTMVQGGTVEPTLGVGDYGQPGAIYSFADLDTYQAGHGGDLPDDVPYLWADVQAANDALDVGFSYNDVFKITSVIYLHESTASAQRKVQWWMQPGGAGEFILMRETLNLPFDVIKYIAAQPYPGQTTNYWVMQIALKELGATFTNVWLTDNYSNDFIPTGTLAEGLTPLVGDYPATGVIKHERLNTYIKRQRVGNAVLREWGEPRVLMNCVVMPQPGFAGKSYYPYERGDQVLVTSRRAGWVNGMEGDTRKLLTVRSIRRIEGDPRSARLKYAVQLGNKMYDLSDPARTHLLRVGESGLVPFNYEIPELQGTNFFFNAPQNPDQFYGVRTEVRVNPIGIDAGGELPTFNWPAGTRKLKIPDGVIPPGTAYEAQHRNVGADGTPSKWSPKYSGVTPPARAYNRPYLAEFPIGDGAQEIQVTASPDKQRELQLNEAASLTGWSIVQDGAGGVTVDIQWISEAARDAGTGAYASLCGTGTKPYTLSTRHGGTANRGHDFRGWAAKHRTLDKGDILRVVITAVEAGTVATTGTVILSLKRLDVAS